MCACECQVFTRYILDLEFIEMAEVTIDAETAQVPGRPPPQRCYSWQLHWRPPSSGQSEIMTPIVGYPTTGS